MRQLVDFSTGLQRHDRDKGSVRFRVCGPAGMLLGDASDALQALIAHGAWDDGNGSELIVQHNAGCAQLLGQLELLETASFVACTSSSNHQSCWQLLGEARTSIQPTIELSHKTVSPFVVCDTKPLQTRTPWELIQTLSDEGGSGDEPPKRVQSVTGLHLCC